jgi:hypothetical protein
MRSRNGNHGSGMMSVCMCLMSILTVKVKHHARIEMINTYLSMIIYIYIQYLLELFIIESRTKKEKEGMRMILRLSECQTNRRWNEGEKIYVCVLLLNLFNVTVVSTIKMKKIGKWWWSGALENIWQKWIEPRVYVYIWTSDDILLSTYIYIYVCVCIWIRNRDIHIRNCFSTPLLTNITCDEYQCVLLFVVSHYILLGRSSIWCSADRHAC